MPAPRDEVDRQFIISEIKRLADESGGLPPGEKKFSRETGIPRARWRGVHWVSWSAALTEAGFKPNSFMLVGFDKGFLLDSLVTAIRVLKKFLSEAELMIYARDKVGFPGAKAFQRHFKTKRETVSALIDHCAQNPQLSDVLEICQPLMGSEPRLGHIGKTRKPIVNGFVYLMRSGKYFKIGKSNHVGRREYQIALTLPEPINTVHSIATDDPEGIEAYWHNRFKAKRAKGEWFCLTQDDVKAFKARKSM